MRSSPNKTTALALDQKAIEGVDTYLATVKSVTIAGTTYSPGDLKAALQGEIDADSALDRIQAQYRQQVVATRLARAKALAMRKLLKTYVLSIYGADAVQPLQTFGIPVPKALGRRSAKSKAKAVDAAKATREARKEANASIDAPAPIAPAKPAAGVTPSN